jgi:hypothetical protein
LARLPKRLKSLTGNCWSSNQDWRRDEFINYAYADGQLLVLQSSVIISNQHSLSRNNTELRAAIDAEKRFHVKHMNVSLFWQPLLKKLVKICLSTKWSGNCLLRLWKSLLTVFTNFQVYSLGRAS